MKKIYLLGLTSMLALAVNAQTTFKVKNPLKKSTTATASDAKLVKGTRNSVAKNVGGNNSVQQVQSTLVCNTPYVAGTTMDLSFTFQMQNTDDEWSDFIAITLPAGIVPTGLGNTSNPFPSENVAGGAEPLNAPTGQIITWGADIDDQFGGIWTPTGVTLVIEVTIAPGTTGNLTSTYDLSGDKYITAPGVVGDQLGASYVINEQQSINMKAIGAAFLDLATGSVISSGCGLTTANVAVLATNNGATAITVPTVGDLLTYTVNATPTSVPATSVLDFNTGAPVTSIASGDTVIIVDLTPVNLSTPGAYSLTAGISFAGSGDGISTDNTAAVYSITHFTAFDATAAAYTMGFEAAEAALFSAWTAEDVNGDGVTWDNLTTAYSHLNSGTCLRRSGSAGASDDDWAYTGCIDLVGGNQYDLSFWIKLFDAASASDVSAYYGSSADAAGMTNLIVAAATATDSLYHLTSGSFTPATTGTYYIGFHNTSATGTSSIRLDDINLVYNPVSIKETALTNLVSIFPNPNAGVFTVKATENNSSVAVYSIIGENVYSAKLTKGNNSIDLTNLAAGSYIVKVNNGGTLVTKRVVINK